MNAMQALATSKQENMDEVKRISFVNYIKSHIALIASHGGHNVTDVLPEDFIKPIADEFQHLGYLVTIRPGGYLLIDWSKPNQEQYRCHKVTELAYLYGKTRQMGRSEEVMEKILADKARVIRENGIAAEKDAKAIREAVECSNPFIVKIDNEPVSVTTRKPQAFEAVKDVTGLEPTFKREYVRRSAVMRSPSEEEAYQAMVTHEGWVSPALYAQSLHKMLRENPTMTHSELAYKICKSYVWLMCFLKKHPDDYVPVTVSNESIVPKALVEKYKDALKSINPTTLTVEPAIREAGLPAPIVCVVEEDGTVKFDIENGRIQNPCGEIILNANAHFVQVSGDKNACPIFQAGKKPCSCDKRRVLDYGCDCGGY